MGSAFRGLIIVPIFFKCDRMEIVIIVEVAICGPRSRKAFTGYSLKQLIKSMGRLWTAHISTVSCALYGDAAILYSHSCISCSLCWS